MVMKNVDAASRSDVHAAVLEVIERGAASSVPQPGTAQAPDAPPEGQPPAVRKHTLPGERWYVLQHSPFEAPMLRAAIRRNGFAVHWPRYIHRPRRGDDVLVPLFGGYLFVRFDIRRAGWGALRRLPGAVGWVRMLEKGAPIPVAQGYVERLIRAAGGEFDGLIDPTGDAASLDWLPVEAPVEVTGTVLAGRRGLLVPERASQRVALLMEAMGVQVTVRLRRDAVAPV